MLVNVDISKLKRYREDKAFSKHKLSVSAGLGKNAIDQMERGKRKSNFIRVQSIANVLGIDPKQLLEGEEK